MYKELLMIIWFNFDVYESVKFAGHESWYMHDTRDQDSSLANDDVDSLGSQLTAIAWPFDN